MSTLGREQYQFGKIGHFTGNLLDRIILCNEVALGQVLSEYLGDHGFIPTFHFRCQGETGEYRMVYPLTRHHQVALPDAIISSGSRRNHLLLDNSERFHGVVQDAAGFPWSFWIPLRHGSETVAILQGFLKGTQSAARKQLTELRHKVGWTALAWHLLTMLEEKERLAFTDSLTGLSNYRFLIHFLHAEIARCQRYNKSAAVLFLDVDQFKNVNDEHGHIVGSKTLEMLGRFLRSRVREADVLVRYGGDEFVVVLTEINLDQARQIGRRLLEEIRDHTFSLGTGSSIKLTLSMGIAVYPFHGTTADSLLEAADKAMYRVKQGPRDALEMAVEGSL